MTDTKQPAEAKDQTLDVGRSDLYATLMKTEFKEKGLTEEGKLPEADVAVEEAELSEEEKEIDPDTITEWQQFKTRWDNIGVIYERLIHCGQALNEEDVLFHMQQLDSAKNFIARAREQLEKGFYYECAAMAQQTGIPCELVPPWMEKPSDVRNVPRKSKEKVFFHKEVDVEEESKSE